MKIDKEFLRGVVAETVCCEPEEISDTTEFVKDLDVSSVQMLEIIAGIEDEYDIEIKLSDFSKCSNIEKVIQMLDSRE